MQTRSVAEGRQGAFHGGIHGAWFGNWAFNRVGSNAGTEMSPGAEKVHPLDAEERAEVQAE